MANLSHWPSIAFNQSIVDSATSTGEWRARHLRNIQHQLRVIEDRLHQMGHLPNDAYFGLYDDQSMDTREKLDRIGEHITVLVNKLKSKTRFDERLYIECGRLIHLRIFTKEVPFKCWLYSKELALKTDVRGAIEANLDFVETTIVRFYTGSFKTFMDIGLQSALKYNESYLADLEGGGKESIGQFFARLAAAAATVAFKTPDMVRVLTRGRATWKSAFGVFFWSLSSQLVVPATPPMMFMGRTVGSTASCYLIDQRTTTNDDTVRSILNEVAPILQSRGGVGIALHTLNQNARSKGLMAVLKMIDSLVMAINADSTRPTGVCVYIEPWHADTRAVLSMKGLLAPEEAMRCDHLFSALWVPDLLFKRYERYLNGEKDVMWTFFDDRASNLSKLYGDRFEREYEYYESSGFGVDSIPIREMMYSIVRSAATTGSPFIVLKDAFNRHYHLDTQFDALSCSNLCTEIVHKADKDSNGVCNLMSINLSRCIVVDRAGRGRFDCTTLRRAVRTATIFVNAMMLCNDYPTEKSRAGMERHRSIGIGLQGLHTTFLRLGLDMVCDEARKLNKRIAELMLLEAMTTSCELCEHGLPKFSDFDESIYSSGRFHFDGWEDVELTEQYEWDELRERVKTSGLYNSQFIALMPTVSSSQVTEVSEGFTPLFSNLFNKVSTTGEILRPNPLLMEELRAIYPDEKDRVEALEALESAQWSTVAAFGNRPECASLMKYKTVFEYNQIDLLNMCRDRAPFVDHSQSTSLYITETSEGVLPASSIVKLLLHAYKTGLKTAAYYCRVRKATNNGVFCGLGESVCTSCAL
nr:UL39 [Anatid alphaherpesvirus 1]